MRWKIKKRSQSTGKDTSSSFANTTLPSATDISLSQYYHNTTELPLSRFIDCIVDDNLHALVISGNPTTEQLSQAWHTIRIQYADAMRDIDYISFARLNREVAQLQMLNSQIQIAITELKNRYTIQFHRALNELLKYKFHLDVNNPEAYDKELRRATNRSKGNLLELRIKEITLNSMLEKMANKGHVMTREYFQQTLITLSDHAEYRLRADDMTVFEYCDRVRRLNTYIDSMQPKKRK